MGQGLRDFYSQLKITLSPATVLASTGAEQTFTVNGLKTSDVIVSVTKPTVQGGLAVTNARVSAADTLALQFLNSATTTLTATPGEVYTVVVMRFEDNTTKTRFNPT